jgi:hypothetical protein
MERSMSVSEPTAAGVTIPDTRLARDATELIRDHISDLVYHHSRRVFWWGSLQGRNRDLSFDPEVLYVAATTPGIPEFMEPEVALVTAGVEYDVLGIGYHDISDADRAAITALHPRPDFKRRILQAFTEGVGPRPDTTFGNVKADVLERFVPGFRRGNFVDAILNSDWPQ